MPTLWLMLEIVQQLTELLLAAIPEMLGGLAVVVIIAAHAKKEKAEPRYPAGTTGLGVAVFAAAP